MALLGILLLEVAGVETSAAQQSWDPTVVTAAGAAVASRVAPPAGKPTPERAPSPAVRSAQRPSYPPERHVVPQRNRDAEYFEEFEREDAAAADGDAASEPDATVERLRFSAPALAAGARGPAEQSAWTPMVTGALGGVAGEGRAPGLTGGPGQAATPHTSATVPPEARQRTYAAQAQGAAEAVGATSGREGATTPATPTAPAADSAPAGEARHEETNKPAGEPAETPAKLAASPAPEAQQKPLEALPPDATPVQQYCYNTNDAAADARFAWQAKKIAEMEAELAKRIDLLESRTEEFKTWLARRDEFSKKANEKLVSFYARMRPDAAAVQLAAMDEETAAALLTKLEPKTASVVMGEMDPARAARIAAIISGAARVPPQRARAPAAGSAKPRAESGAPSTQSKTRS
jgi:flagellar motility protein MotE (MotC chaperone)